jgi:hypothetical protein
MSAEENMYAVENTGKYVLWERNMYSEKNI